MKTTAKTMGRLGAFCYANHPDVQEVTGLTEAQILNAVQLMKAAPNLLCELKALCGMIERYKDNELRMEPLVAYYDALGCIAAAEGKGN